MMEEEGPKVSMSIHADPWRGDELEEILQSASRGCGCNLPLLLRRAAGLESQTWTADWFLRGTETAQFASGELKDNCPIRQ